MGKQMVMPGIDNELSKAADEMVDLLEEQGKLSDEREKATEKLLQAMGNAGKTKLCVRGITFKAEELQGWKLKISKGNNDD